MPAIAIAFCFLAQLAPAAAAPAGRAEYLLRSRPWTGDFDGVLKRRTLRILVPFSKTLFFVDRGKQMGVVAEFGRELETWLNARHSKNALRLHVAFVPTARDQLFAALKAGKGDVIAANLTITPERQAEADFTRPWLRGVKEIVVTGPSSPPLAALDDLAGATVHARRSSSYFEHLETLSAALKARGKKPLDLKTADEHLEDEDLLEMVNAGLLPFAVVDDHKADIWRQVFNQLKARPDLIVSSGGDVAWAIRKESPLLKAELDAFFETHTSMSSFGATVKRRYYSDAKVVKNAFSEEAAGRFKQLVSVFVKYGRQFGFDPVLLIAQAFQESQLDQKRRSPAGAVGLMQIKPSTAAGKPIGIVGLHDVLRAGVAAYLPQRIGGQFARGAMHTVGLVLWFIALPKIPMADTTAISFMSPIFIMLGPYLFFREAMRWDRWLAALIGLPGTDNGLRQLVRASLIARQDAEEHVRIGAVIDDRPHVGVVFAGDLLSPAHGLQLLKSRGHLRLQRRLVALQERCALARQPLGRGLLGHSIPCR